MKPTYRARRVLHTLAEYELPLTMSREIGRIIVRWSYLESLAQSLIRRKLKLSHAEARIALREPRLSDRLTMFRDLALLKDRKWDQGRLKSIITRAIDLKAARDLVAHSMWSYHHDYWHVQHTRGTYNEDIAKLAKGKTRTIDPEAVRMGLVELKAMVASLDELIRDLRAFRDAEIGPPLP